MSKNDRPTLGQVVWFSAKLERHGDGANMRWLPKTLENRQLGLYMGMRTVYNGIVVRGTYDDPSHLSDLEGVTHALIVTHERKAPVRVPFDAIHYTYEDLSQQPDTL